MSSSLKVPRLLEDVRISTGDSARDKPIRLKIAQILTNVPISSLRRANRAEEIISRERNSETERLSQAPFKKSSIRGQNHVRICTIVIASPHCNLDTNLYCIRQEMLSLTCFLSRKRRRRRKRRICRVVIEEPGRSKESHRQCREYSRSPEMPGCSNASFTNDRDSIAERRSHLCYLADREAEKRGGYLAARRSLPLCFEDLA